MTFEPFALLARDVGMLNALLYAAARALGVVTFGRAKLRKYYITAQPVPTVDITPPRRGRQIIVSELQADEIAAMGSDRPPEVLKARIANGCRCLAARKDRVLVGFQWFTLRDYPEDEVRCLFQLAQDDHCAWDFDIFVLPEWRTQPVFTRLWDKCNHVLRDAGVNYSLSRINAFNTSSRRAHERIGAQIIGWALFLALGPAQIAMFSDRPWIHASLRGSSVPVLAVSRMARKSAAFHTGTTA